MDELDSVYDPKSYEPQILDLWLSSGVFAASADSPKKPYTILMPPPNVTSRLHMGHGTGYTIQDLLVRWKRMCGFEACWLPGTDHAGIATQMMVEQALASEGITRQQLGREAFFERLKDWKETYGGIIVDQLKRMGYSADWSRIAYTMDPNLSDAVRYVFVKLFEEGLIYRGERLVNWDTVLQTALSDDEVENIEITGALYTIRYPLVDSEEFITVATTRPETVLGDTAVAVNPDDERFARFIGRKVRLPLAERLIPVIGDSYVKMDFGTGALKITPAHDFNDFEIGRRHALASLSVIDDRGRMAGNDVPERLRGLDRFAARKEIVRSLKELALFEDEKPYKHSVPHSERSKTIIEPKLSQQWFVKMADLAQPAAEAARNGDLHFYPDTWKKTYLYWLDNIQDWCISRQLWWGHRIPIWNCAACKKPTTGLTDPSVCSHCGASELKQDEDVLDTWFSSWLWPLSPFGWPEETATIKKELNYFYPSDVLITGPDIIFLWVARMIMVGLKFKGEVPFRDVYFNATVCDKKGRTFSKTLGNGIDPLDVIDKHGADAVRFTAVSLAPLGGRVRMDVNDFDHGARFVNKLWNAARFITRHAAPGKAMAPLKDLHPTLPESWLLTEFQRTAVKVNRLLEAYRLNEAVDAVYHFIWGSFCDWGLECAKENLQGTDAAAKAQTMSVLVYVLNGSLRLAHPVIPFVTEKIWQQLPLHPDWDKPKSLVIAKYPDGTQGPVFAAEAADWGTVQEIVSGIRSVRQQSGLPTALALSAHIRTDQHTCTVLEQAKIWVMRLANVSHILASPEQRKPPRSICYVGKGFEIYLPVEGHLDVEKERKRLEQEKIRIEKIVAGYNAKLANVEFVKNAPEEVIEQTKEQHRNMSEQLRTIALNLTSLSN